MGEKWEGKYETVGSPSDVSFTDPTGKYGAALDQMLNSFNQYQQQMSQNAGSSQRYMDQLAGAGAVTTYDPDAYMQQFLGQSAGLANMAQGATAPLGQSLNAIAERNARLGSEAALAAMPGAANSGAGMAAFADAYASPFAQAAAQTQQAQLGLTGQLWNQAMGNNAAAQQFATSNQQFNADLNAQIASQLASLAQQNEGMYGGLAQSALGNYGQLASGMGSLYTPQYEYRPGISDQLWGLGQVAVGGLAGGLGGALGRAFGQGTQKSATTTTTPTTSSAYKPTPWVSSGTYPSFPTVSVPNSPMRPTTTAPYVPTWTPPKWTSPTLR